MYTVDETFAEIEAESADLVEDRIEHSILGEIRAICWKTIGCTHGRDHDLWCIRSWVNNEWNDTVFVVTKDRARVLFLSYFDNSGSSQ